MTRDELFKSDRNERNYYLALNQYEDMKLPLTRDGFEALVELASELNHLPVDDIGRSCVAGYVHHIANDKCTTTLNDIANVLYKSVTNQLTWEIDQEIKLKKQTEFAAKQEVMRQEAELKKGLVVKESPLSLVPQLE